jgi:hypothetical protein
MDSGSGVGEFERDEQPLFGSESPGFVNLVFCEPITEFTGTPGATEERSQSFQFHEAILPGNSWFVTITEFLQPSFKILRQLFPLPSCPMVVIGHPS